MANHKDEAERLRLGIQGGWLPISEAISWADRLISESPTPDPALLDIALAANWTRSEVASLLGKIAGVADSVAVMRRCLGDLLHVVEERPDLARDAARWLEITANEGRLPESEFGWEPRALDDEFALADQGYGSDKAACSRLLAFLRQHALANAPNFTRNSGT
jgi:hypothetical protein